MELLEADHGFGLGSSLLPRLKLFFFFFWRWKYIFFLTLMCHMWRQVPLNPRQPVSNLIQEKNLQHGKSPSPVGALANNTGNNYSLRKTKNLPNWGVLSLGVAELRKVCRFKVFGAFSMFFLRRFLLTPKLVTRQQGLGAPRCENGSFFSRFPKTLAVEASPSAASARQFSAGRLCVTVIMKSKCAVFTLKKTEFSCFCSPCTPVWTECLQS